MPSVTVTNRGITPRDGVWLSLAVLLHASLLMVPVQRDESPADRPERLQVKLQVLPAAVPPVKPAEPEPFVEQQEPLIDTPPEPVADTTVPVDPPAVAVIPEPEPPEPGEQPRDEKRVTAATLLHSASEMDWAVETPESGRTLGEAAPFEMPENWRPMIPMGDNRFDGMTVPRKVEIVDRWLSSDGTHHVVLNTPTGHTLCGSGKAWDPMQPLVEHVMQFRPCGGGGKRTFVMPERYRR